MGETAHSWHSLEPETVERELATAVHAGLTDAEAAARLLRFGANELVERGARSPWAILWEQVTALMMVILIIAAGVSAALGDFKDTVAIGAIVVLNALLGFTQEYRAEKAMAALKRLAAPVVKVRRGGIVREIASRDLVPGDIVLLEAGNAISADCRLVELAGLRTHEAALTGESEPVEKNPAAMTRTDTALGDRVNMAYMGTFATAGRGVGIVTATGMCTELGRIASLLEEVEPEATPLQRRLDHLGKWLALVALGLVAVIFALGLLRGEDLKLLFLTAVSIGVAAVPEGLPAVVTIALSLGAQRMLARRVLIRKLPAVETLGSVTVICSDKTGTLTENRMTAVVLQLPDRMHDLRSGQPPLDPALRLLLTGACLCNDASVQKDQHIGDPTETALTEVAQRFGLLKPDLERLQPRIAELPFTSERKRMTTVHREPGGGVVAFTKGAVDALLDICPQLDAETRHRVATQNEELARGGIRVLGVAFREFETAPSLDDLERDLAFIGMIGIADPPRAEAVPAVERSKTAGIRPVMITGDHPLTALAIARQLGIANEPASVTGPELDQITLSELESRAESVPVYARVSPEHKLKIVESLQRRGHIVAMTGDGVNDAPALKKADIGVAMGLSGTDVAKEAADMVLVDDNFASIVAAVEEGRTIYDNVRKFIRYILATNSGEIWLMLAAPFLGMPLPLLPLQILWMNLVTDGLPALALGVEPPERDTMRRPPYPPNESIFARGLGLHVLWVGLLMAALSLGAGYWFWHANDPAWRTIIFTTLTLSQIGHALAIRSERESLLSIGLLSNPALLGAASLTVVLQVALIYVPFLSTFFQTHPLSVAELAFALALSSVVFWAVELEKWVRRVR
ncbi:MAG: cation-translocating P-type ATPase [Bryobacteraceae bacterium]